MSELKKLEFENEETDDFKSPTVIRKASKLLPKQVNKEKKKKIMKSAKVNKNDILKTTKDNFEYLDVNPENLQMALALSKSAFETENQLIAEDLPIFLNTSKTSKLNILKEFGFKSDRSKVSLGEPQIREVCTLVQKVVLIVKIPFTLKINGKIPGISTAEFSYQKLFSQCIKKFGFL